MGYRANTVIAVSVSRLMILLQVLALTTVPRCLFLTEVILHNGKRLNRRRR